MRDQQYLAVRVKIMIIFLGCLYATITAEESSRFKNTTTTFVKSEKLNSNNNRTAFNHKKLNGNNISEPFYEIRKKYENYDNAELKKLIKLHKCLKAQDVKGQRAVFEIIKKCDEDYDSKTFSDTIKFEKNNESSAASNELIKLDPNNNSTASGKHENWNASVLFLKPKILRVDCISDLAAVVAKVMTLAPGTESKKQVCAQFKKLRKSCSLYGSDPYGHEQVYRVHCKAMGIFNSNKFLIILFVLLATIIT